MTYTLPSSAASRDLRLWLIAVSVSLVINIAVVIGMAFTSLLNTVIVKEDEKTAADERVVKIIPVIKPVEEAPKEEAPTQFARTSEDQTEEIPDNPSFIGERDTVATSDNVADPNAPDLPSQTGVEPELKDSIETTESNYQDGELSSTDPASATVEPTETPAKPAEEKQNQTMPNETALQEEAGEPAPIEKLAQSPNEIEIPAIPEDLVEEQPKDPLEAAKRNPTPETEKVEETPKTTNASQSATAGFRGFQQKTELKGSISRQGRSALDVKSGPLGKYYAEISRAIEQSWQREVTKRRDFIVPGVLRIRVVLDEEGYIRTVSTVEEAGVGKIQVGFTHQAIRTADIPKMPAEVKKQLDGEPLELLYNFIF